MCGNYSGDPVLNCGLQSLFNLRGYIRSELSFWPMLKLASLDPEVLGI